MNVKRWALVTASLITIAASTTACGSDEDAAAGAPKVSTFEGDPITIGTICSCSSDQAAALGESTQGVAAWVDMVNRTGGLNGHPVELIVKDDAGDPAKGLQAVKELVEQEGVVAIVGMTSTTDAAWKSYIEKKKVPVVGGLASEATFITSPDFFPSGGNSIMQTFGAMKEATDAGVEKMGILYCAETPVCAQVDGIGTAFSQQLGIGYTSGKISATAPDYNAACLNLKDDGVDGLFIAHNSSVVKRVAAGCVQNGFEPQDVALMNGLAKETIEDPNFEGTLLSGALAMYTDTEVPGVEEYNEAVETYNPGFTDTAGFNPVAQFSWSGGKLFEAAAKAAELGPDSTPADVYQGLYALENETLGGMAPPLNFVEGKPAFPSCYFRGAITGGELTAPTSEPVCLSEAQVGQMGQLLSALG